MTNEQAKQEFIKNNPNFSKLFIEINNGWIRIEPDGSNLPKKKEWVLCYHPNPSKGSHYGNNHAILYFNSDDVNDEFAGWMHQNGYAQTPTHYKKLNDSPVY